MEIHKLKPCPFCCSEAELFARSQDKASDWDVRCINTDCYLEDGAAWCFATPERAAEEWNDRTTC